jgi:hypothetical protein
MDNRHWYDPTPVMFFWCFLMLSDTFWCICLDVGDTRDL